MMSMYKLYTSSTMLGRLFDTELCAISLFYIMLVINLTFSKTRSKGKLNM